MKTTTFIIISYIARRKWRAKEENHPTKTKLLKVID